MPKIVPIKPFEQALVELYRAAFGPAEATLEQRLLQWFFNVIVAGSCRFVAHGENAVRVAVAGPPDRVIEAFSISPKEFRRIVGRFQVGVAADGKPPFSSGDLIWIVSYDESIRGAFEEFRRRRAEPRQVPHPQRRAHDLATLRLLRECLGVLEGASESCVESLDA